MNAALRDWIDAVKGGPYGYKLNKATVTSFIRELNEYVHNYAQDDLDVALRLVEIAAAKCANEFKFARYEYENNLKQNAQANVVSKRDINEESSGVHF